MTVTLAITACCYRVRIEQFHSRSKEGVTCLYLIVLEVWSLYYMIQYLFGILLEVILFLLFLDLLHNYAFKLNLEYKWYLPLFPLTSSSRPSPSTNSTLPSSRIATKILKTSTNGMPNVAKAPWEGKVMLTDNLYCICCHDKNS